MFDGLNQRKDLYKQLALKIARIGLYYLFPMKAAQNFHLICL